MPRIRIWLIGAVGLLTLLILAGVLAGLFGGLAGPTPGQTAAPTPVVSAATATPPPYPPPSSPAPQPTPPGTPIVAPTPRVTVVPTPAVTVVPGPLPPGLKIVCAEDWEDERTVVIWTVNVNDLAHVQIIAKLPSQMPGSSLGGYISPDGRQLAYILPGKYIWQGTLGVMNIDGSDNKVLEAPILGWGTEMNLKWATDSRWIAYLRDVSPGGRSDGGTGIWLVRPDGSEKKQIITITPSGAVGLLGWSADSSLLYYVAEGKLWKVNIEGEALPAELVRLEQDVSYAQLSPDAQKILYLTREARPAAPLTLGVASLDSQEKHIIVEKVNPSLFAFENYQLHPIWSPDSTQVLYNAMIDSRHVEIIAARWNAPGNATVVRHREEVYYYPVSWSPDGRFIVASRYPLGADPLTEFHRVLISLSGNVQRIHTIRPDSLLPGFIGWLEEGSRK